MYAFLFAPMRATCLAYLILDFIILIIENMERAKSYGAPHYAVSPVNSKTVKLKFLRGGTGCRLFDKVRNGIKIL
jgi:hypothetical protein